MQEKRPIGVFDLTARCPLRCQHCYMNLDLRRCKDLPDALFLQRLKQRIKAYDLRSAFWVGGEPLLRPKLLLAAMSLLSRNAVATSGTVPIPPGLTDIAGLLVSVEGPQPLHDALRGPGTYEKTRSRLSSLRKQSFALSTTLCRQNVGAVEALPKLNDELNSLGVLVGFFVGPKGSPLRVEGDERNRAIDRLLDLKQRHPNVLLNTAESIARFAGKQDMSEVCIYKHSAIAFDHRLKEKQPCTFGSEADCSLCGCPVVALQVSRRDGEKESLSVLRQLFPKRSGEKQTTVWEATAHGGAKDQ